MDPTITNEEKRTSFQHPIPSWAPQAYQASPLGQWQVAPTAYQQPLPQANVYGPQVALNTSPSVQVDAFPAAQWGQQQAASYATAPTTMNSAMYAVHQQPMATGYPPIQAKKKKGGLLRSIFGTGSGYAPYDHNFALQNALGNTWEARKAADDQQQKDNDADFARSVALDDAQFDMQVEASRESSSSYDSGGGFSSSFDSSSFSF